MEPEIDCRRLGVACWELTQESRSHIGQNLTNGPKEEVVLVILTRQQSVSWHSTSIGSPLGILYGGHEVG